jgi:hypothetical protein
VTAAEPAPPTDGLRGWCLNCIEWGDPPDPSRAHPAAECPWRPEPDPLRARLIAAEEAVARVEALVDEVDARPRYLTGDDLRRALVGDR